VACFGLATRRGPTLRADETSRPCGRRRSIAREVRVGSTTPTRLSERPQREQQPTQEHGSERRFQRERFIESEQQKAPRGGGALRLRAKQLRRVAGRTAHDEGSAHQAIPPSTKSIGSPPVFASVPSRRHQWREHRFRWSPLWFPRCAGANVTGSCVNRSCGRTRRRVRRGGRLCERGAVKSAAAAAAVIRLVDFFMVSSENATKSCASMANAAECCKKGAKKRSFRDKANLPQRRRAYAPTLLHCPPGVFSCSSALAATHRCVPPRRGWAMTRGGVVVH
jgi:hypothetical protein